MLSQEALDKIIGIKEIVPLSHLEMAKIMKVTFFPFDEEYLSKNILNFYRDLKIKLNELGVEVIPYEKSLKHISLYKAIIRCTLIFYRNIYVLYNNLFTNKEKLFYISFQVFLNTLFKRDRVKAGISIISLGESKTGNLPMDNTSSFKDTSVITILDFPKNIKKDSDFHEHFNTAMNMFAHHMTNIVVAIDNEKFVVYNFNASHPIYSLTDGKLKEHLLEAVIPKVVAPIRPYKLSEFIIMKDSFNINDNIYKKVVNEFVDGGRLFDTTKLYPPGKRIDSLPFRNNFYKWIGKIHLDNRNGMSYGFLAWQMPAELSEVFPATGIKNILGIDIIDKDWFYVGEDLFVVFEIDNKKLYMKVPEVWVMTQRSGSDKTHINPEKDLVKIGLKNGEMFLQTPKGLILDDDYKPSFDTKVILSHAVGNVMLASIFNYFNKQKEYVKKIKEEGSALAHWHGYINPEFIPQGFFVHGLDNPHVACSSPQSAIYALNGKLNMLNDILNNKKPFIGDIHIEPHHGTNINFDSISSLANFFIENKEASSLGNKYLELYK